jgi:hypothetical protein
VVAVAVAALAGAGVGIAAGVGVFNGRPAAFNGLNAAQHARSGANVLPPAILGSIKRDNAFEKKSNAQAAKSGTHFHVFPVRPDTARLLAKTPDATFYVLTDTRGYLCYYEVFGHMSLDGNCVRPLSKSQPTTLDSSNGCNPTTGCILTVAGIAMDGVTSVSFTVLDNGVTVPVKNNVYTLKRQSTARGVQCAVAHFADGSTVKLTGYPSCPADRQGASS